jgi:hypothetical protein
MCGKISTRDLKEQVAPKKNTRHGTGLDRVHAEVPTYGWQRLRNIGSINERHAIHYCCHGNDSDPSLTNHRKRSPIAGPALIFIAS